ncbi:hypothetical protein ACOMHN_011841 [Nucella lapillus]
MERKPVYADRWSESCLERAERMGEQVYLRTMARKVAWSPVKERFLPTEAECENITLDEAFNSLSESLRQVTWECRKFHANRDLVKDFKDCADHCSRFHTQQPKPQLPYRGNPTICGPVSEGGVGPDDAARGVLRHHGPPAGHRRPEDQHRAAGSPGVPGPPLQHLTHHSSDTPH